MVRQPQYGDRSSYKASDRTYPGEVYYNMNGHAVHSGRFPSTRFGPLHAGINYGPVLCGQGSPFGTKRDS